MEKNKTNSLLAYSPMLHARHFAEKKSYRDKHFQPTKAGSPYLDGHPTHDRPLFVQFCANDPDVLLQAAQIVAPHCDAIDLNLGCPQGIAKKGHYGAYLQEEWDLISRMISHLHNNLSVPVTAKIRILETKEKTLEYARVILCAGASIIAVHGRTREQKGHNTGLADWSVIRYLRDNLPTETVIFANGNILEHGDLHRCLKATGADGVMSAEANLHDPSIFSAITPPMDDRGEYWYTPSGLGGVRIDAVMRRYLDIVYIYVLNQRRPKRPVLYHPFQSQISDTSSSVMVVDSTQSVTIHRKDLSINLAAMQSHLFGLLRPLLSRHRHIRDALAKARAGDMGFYESILGMVEGVTKEGLIEYYSTGGDGTFGSASSTLSNLNKPWWICQAYIRPLPSEALAKGAIKLSSHAQKRDLMLKGIKAQDQKAIGASLITWLSH